MQLGHWYKTMRRVPVTRAIGDTSVPKVRMDEQLVFVTCAVTKGGRHGFEAFDGTRGPRYWHCDTLKVKPHFIPAAEADAYVRCGRDGGPYYDDNMEIPSLYTVAKRIDWREVEDMDLRHLPTASADNDDVGSW